jgi:plastocyanin
MRAHPFHAMGYGRSADSVPGSYPAKRGLWFVALAGLLVALFASVWMATDADAGLRRALGIRTVTRAALPQGISVSLSAPGTMFEPSAGLVAAGGSVTFHNALTIPLLIRSTVPSPSAFVGRVAPHGVLSVRLTRPGLYHYYDALTATPLHVIANSEVLRALPGKGVVRQGWIAVLPRVPTSLHAALNVPANQDMFTPKAVVTLVGGTIVVSNHDADAHNFVVDPASPGGAAFIIDGTDEEPPNGWKRSLVVERAGLYHIYCTMHTRVIGVVDGWHIVAPRPKASGYKDHNAMDAWVIALPVTTVTG